MDAHPIQLSFSGDLSRSRLTTFFRMVLLVPHIIWTYLYGLAVGVVFVVAWVGTLFGGRMPDGMHNFIVDFLAYNNRLVAYMLFLTNPYPPFNGSDPYSVNLTVPPPAKQNRLGVLFRGFLVIPASFVAMLYGIVMSFTTGLAFFAILITGRMPRSFQRWGEKTVHYNARIAAYQFLLTSQYPKIPQSPE
jgi:hypothetical protein